MDAPAELTMTDNYGEELILHKSSNLLNQMLPSAVSQSSLGKRERSDTSAVNDVDVDHVPEEAKPKRKVKTISKLTKD